MAPAGLLPLGREIGRSIGSGPEIEPQNAHFASLCALCVFAVNNWPHLNRYAASMRGRARKQIYHRHASNNQPHPYGRAPINLLVIHGPAQQRHQHNAYA